MSLWVNCSEDMWKRSLVMRENVPISCKHEYRRLSLSSRCDVICDVTNMENIFLGEFAYDLFIFDVKLQLYRKLKNFEK